ncbi:hypothetical protein QTJ16_006401 [Diplocarpon rosae]|uniref:Cylicin I n=1 Tax=Diplocarpon rosae TaxID=946125 RepID=A0AAD9WCJ6_9HELO|nr:hypothetical protein QTJ16_006401 [Diplocarpon rosae]PBP28044.1 hypothetical protein BUE80_DR000880 [Diplocarpon rosae]
MAESATPKTSYSNDPALYIYTSLTAGSSHIVTATSRMETILKANRIPFKAIDLATDEKARMLWGRRAGKDASGRQRKIPGLVQMGLVLGDLVEVEDWNEYGELKQHVKIVNAPGSLVLKPALQQPASAPVKGTPAPAAKENVKPEPKVTGKTDNGEAQSPASVEPTPISLALRQVGQEAAQKAKENNKSTKPVKTLSGAGKAALVKEEKKPLEDSVKEGEKDYSEAVPKETELKATGGGPEETKEDEEKPLESSVQEGEKESSETVSKESELKAPEEAKEDEKKTPEEVPEETEQKSLEEAPKVTEQKTVKAILPPISIAAPTANMLPAKKLTNIENTDSFQSPSSTAWKSVAGIGHKPQKSIDRLDSIQSPTTSAFKPIDMFPTIMLQKDSSVSEAPPAEIEKVEDACRIPEEDET